MGFWGVEIKPGKPYPYHSDNVQGTLYVTQATLGLGSSTEKSTLQCSVGHKSPVFLCSLLPDKTESCSLNLSFKDELVAFSVLGQRSIHLSGYFESNEGDRLRDEYESDSGEDIADTESDESSEYDYDDEYDYGEEYDNDDDFLDDDDEDGDFEIFPPSPLSKSAVVIEEITEDDKPANVSGKSKHSKKKNQSSGSEDQNNSQWQIVANKKTGVSVLESEDEDGFPISASQRSKVTAQENQAESDGQKGKIAIKETKKKEERDVSYEASGKKRKVKSSDPDDQPEKKKKSKKKKEKGKELNNHAMDEDNKNADLSDKIWNEEVKKQDSPDGNDQRGVDIDADSTPRETPSGKKKKNKKNKNKNKTQDLGGGLSTDQIASVVGDNKIFSSEPGKQSEAKCSKVRTFSNGLMIEDLSIGEPNAKRASPGNKVSVRYIGKLKKNGKIFDSNVGRAPFKFRLGVGQVIKGWDVGINGMRVGDKRRLTIPPSMGYGDKGAGGGKIPPNSWLVFDVELVNVH